jgi:hypothetical protein
VLALAISLSRGRNLDPPLTDYTDSLPLQFHFDPRHDGLTGPHHGRVDQLPLLAA